MKVGSFCTGVGGLDLAVERHFGAVSCWHSEVEPAPLTVLEREWPGVPNLGDLTTLDWSQVEPVDIITAGYPCQPFSHAGLRKGSSDARHLWPYIAEAVRVLRPRWVVLENVAGHLTLGFGDVLGDLAEAGFDAEWCVLRASDVGAPHRRERVFVVASDASGAGTGWDDRAVPGEVPRRAGEHVHAVGDAGDRPAPAADRGAGQEPHLGTVEPGLGTPRRRDPERLGMGDHRTDGGTFAAPHAKHDGRDGAKIGRGPGQSEIQGWVLEPQGRGAEILWGTYEPAIRRWEHVLGRPAPTPVDDRGRLNPPFVEWMMGYPEGWTAGLPRTKALKALGNAVVPQQALAALSVLAPLEEMAA